MAAEYEAFLKRIQEGLQKEEEKVAAAREKEKSKPESIHEPAVLAPKVNTQQQKSILSVTPQVPKDVAVAQGKGTFKDLYEQICENIRAAGTLDIIMQDFQELKTDLDKVTYISQLSELENLHLEENFSRKSKDDASNYEKVYDLLIPNEASAQKALEVIKKCIQKTPVDDISSLAVRYMKRGWAFLLLEQFEHAAIDAKKSLSSGCPVEQIWNAHEILGHVYAQQKIYKESEVNFLKALEYLRKSNAVNEVKATVTVRIMTVFKTIKSQKGKKSSGENEKEKETIKQPKISYGVNKNYPSASAALEFVNSKEHGRCVIAKRDIKPGDVLMVDSPYCSILNPDYLATHCFHCYKRALVPVPCNSCAKVCYCSEECRVASWNGLHSKECCVLNHIIEPGIGKIAFLTFRVLTTLSWSKLQKLREKIDSLVEAELQETNKGDGEVGATPDSNTDSSQQILWEGQYSPNDYRTILHLETNTSKRTFGDLFKRSVTACFLAHCLKISGYFTSKNITQEDELFVASLLLRHLQSSSCNAYEISEYELGPEGIEDTKMNEIGAALYSTVSLTNHACFSNASRTSIGDKSVLRAIRSIPKGTEVFDNYGFHYYLTTVNERQEVMQNQYKFTCVCPACTSMWSLYPHHPTETLIFRCPAPDCGYSCCYSNTSRSKCNMCGNQQEYSKLLKDIESQLKRHKDALNKLRDGDVQAALPVFIAHMEFLEQHVVLPIKHFSDLQEAIKQCFNYLGNKHNPHYKVEPAVATETPQQRAIKLKAGKNKFVNPNKK